MNLKTNIDFDLKHFFHWWGRELSYYLPEKFKQILSDKSGHVFLSITDETLIFQQVIEGKEQQQISLPLDDLSSERYQQLISENNELEKANFVLRLTAGQAIKKILYLPAVAKENLLQVISFEMDRVTPFSVDQVYFSVKILGKEELGKIKVLLVLTPKDILDPICQQLKDAQIYPSFVDYSEAANDFSKDLDTYNLLPISDRPEKNKTTQIAVWCLSIISIILAIAVLIFPVWQQGQEVDGLKRQLKALEKDTRLVQSQQLEIDELVNETQRLIEIKNSIPPLTEIINMMSQLMPDHTWLTHLKYNDNHIQIQGKSPTASALISVLEASPLFGNARFVSPLTQDKRTGLERFQISMDVNMAGDTNE